MAEKTTKKKSTKSNTKKNSETRKKVEEVVDDIKYVGSDNIKKRKTYAEKQQFYAICYIAIGILLCCFAFIPGIKLWASIRGVLFAVFGNGFFLLTFLMFALGIIAATNKFRRNPMTLVYLSVSFTCLFSSLIHIITSTVSAGGFSEWWNQLKESASIGWYVSTDGVHLTGGVLGSFFGGGVLHLFGKEAAIATITILLVVNIMLLTGLTLNIIGKSIKDVLGKIKENLSRKREIRIIEKEELKKRIEEERKQAEREKEIIAKVIEEKEQKRKAELELRRAEIADKLAERRQDISSAKIDKTEYKNPFDASVESVFSENRRTDTSKDDDPIAHSSNPDFRFTNPFIRPKKEETEETKANPYTHPQKEAETEIEVEAEIETEEDIDDPNIISPFSASQTASQMSFDDNSNDELVKKANDEANEKQKENMDTVKNFKDSKITRKREYKKPPVTLLKKPTFDDNGDYTSEMKETSQRLLNILKSFRVETFLTGVSRGPSVTRYELQPASGVKISKIENLSKDIALGLATSKVIIAPVPNKSSVGVEVPNATRSTVTFREMVSSDDFQRSKSKLYVALGKDIAGNIVCTDLAKMPHLLVAGTTGSGKSVCLNCMITSILYNASPAEVKLLMIDPKQVEFSMYNGIPHLLVPVVSNPRKASGALAWAVAEMENRYKAFAECGVRDIKGFNKLCETNDELKPMPQIVIFIDELSDLMMISPKEVEDSICRIAQKARAAGMHLVVATQRPSVDVITGLIKANIPSRIALSVSSQVDSRTILDKMGAESLLGNGDMLFSPVGIGEPTRIQGAYISENEIEDVVTYLKMQEECKYDSEIMEEIEKNAASSNNKKGSALDSDNSDDDRDEMLEAAIEVVVESGQASTTLLQRKLRLGYARAARIMDQLEANGIVGAASGSKPRQVLITKQQLYEMKAYADSVNGSDE